MSFSKSYIATRLGQGYINTPIPLKGQVLVNLASQLCHNMKIKEHIFFHSWHPDQMRKEWDESLLKCSTEICSSLFIAPSEQKWLNDHIRKKALELLAWSAEWKRIFDIPYHISAHIWTPGDWTDNFLDKRKIAERMLLDERLSCEQRYRLACTYCIEESIFSLWEQMTFVEKDRQLNHFYGFQIIQLWSLYIIYPQSFRKDHLYLHIFMIASHELQLTALIHSWNKISRIFKLRCLNANCNFFHRPLAHDDDDYEDDTNDEDDSERNEDDDDDGELREDNREPPEIFMGLFINAAKWHKDMKDSLPACPFMIAYILKFNMLTRINIICFLLSQVYKYRIIGFRAVARDCKDIIQDFLTWPF